jgi:acyl-CoA thioesterase-1
MLRRSLLSILCAAVFTSAFAAGAEPTASTPLPKVLILGDSISIGYTPVVRKLLAERADVQRPNGNCQHSAYGLANVKKWVGDVKWDVIHFNFGIWDTHMLDGQNQLVRDETAAPGPLHIRHTPEQYRKNLEQIIAVLQASGAKLIFANTTPIMKRTGKRFEDIKTLNATAAALMNEKQIPINDLYEFVLPNAKEWQTGDQVHFNAVGNEALGRRVAEAIEQQLSVAK